MSAFALATTSRTRRSVGKRKLLWPWIFLLAGCNYDPYSNYSYDPYYPPYWESRDRSGDQKRESQQMPPAPTYTPPPAPSSVVGRTIGDALRGNR